MTFNKETIKRRSALFLFWAWHLIYSVLVLFLVLPELAKPLFESAMEDTTPWHYVLYSVLIAILPFVSMYLGARYFQKNFRLLMKYFYGFEMPLLFFLLVRIFTFRDDGLAVNLLMLNVILGLGAWLVFLLIQQRKDPTTDTADVPLPTHWLATAGSTILAGVGVYFGTIFLIIQLPIAVEFISEIAHALSRITWSDFGEVLLVFINPLWWLFGLFLLFTISLFLVLPLAMIYLYIGQFLRRLPYLKSPLHWAVILMIILINVGIFNSATQQPQQTVFELLESDTPRDETALVEHHETIREGLLNAYLARYRYMSTTNLSNRITQSYQRTFGMTRELAAVPQRFFNTLLKPFLYDGKDWGDKERAANHYAEFFDMPIQKAERDIIMDTVKHTWEISRDNAAGLLDAANHYVHLDKQSIDTYEHKGVATITVQQTLQNLTYQAKETVLHFSLPEEAVLTGVWLSDNKKQPKKYPYALAPKGAAQSVYKAEVNRRVDPALLEKTGPYQYRLRVYPVPRKVRGQQDAKPLYARFSYETLADAKGNWPVPEVLEKRNIFWDKHTQYSVNGKVLDYTETHDSFPKQLAQSKTEPTDELVFQLQEQRIQAVPRQHELEPLPKSGRFAVIIDGSYSMQDLYSSALDSLEQFKASGIQFDRYFCKEVCKPFSVNPSERPLFFGNSQTLDHIRAFTQASQNKQYDAVLALTDAGSYELADESDQPLAVSQPLWLVHLGESVPYAYDDKILDTLYRSKGGITTSAVDALRRFQLLGQGALSSEITAPTGSTLISVSDQYLWFASPETKKPIRASSIAAGHWIQHLIRTMDTQKLDKLDEIHNIAKRYNIVTHYSSMLVLVNNRQKEALKKAEEADDRFDREVETGKQQASSPSDPFAVPAVPEPEEWALIIIVMMLLSYTLWRRRQDSIGVRGF